MRSRTARAQLLLASVFAFGFVGGPCLAQAEAHDPWERVNRKMFGFEEFLDRHIFGPLARSYSKTPSSVRKGLMNFTTNLGEPVVFANDMMQGHVGQAATTLGRMSINTIFGVAGFIDVAGRSRIPHHDNSFGTTLARYRVKPGPYLFLPLIGPSTLRDALGSVADIGMNPLTYAQYPGQIGVQATTTVVGGLNTRVEAQQQLDTIRATSTDPYATIRSFFLQNRQSQITGQEVKVEELPEFDTGPATEAPPAGSVSPVPGPPVIEPQPAAPSPPLPGAAGALPRPEAVPPEQGGPPPANPAPAQPAPAEPPPSP